MLARPSPKPLEARLARVAFGHRFAHEAARLNVFEELAHVLFDVIVDDPVARLQVAVFGRF